MAVICKNDVKIICASPIGEIVISGCNKGMHFIKRVDKMLTVNPDLKNEFKMISSNTENIPKSVQECIQWFTAYFDIDKTNYKKQTVLLGNHPLLCPELGISEFSMKIYLLLASKVKFGSRCSYSKLAELADNPKAQRAVGSAMKNNPFIIVVPCHRVVKKSGEIGYYSGGPNLKEWLLEYEKSLLKNAIN